ncbi:MAG: putative membrane protein [Gammaproteobacteria bacterium]|jgi:uncharacterized membrane protein
MKKFKNFILITVLGGLVVILPVVILLKLIIWLITWFSNFIQPLTDLVLSSTLTNIYIAEIVSMSSILLVCFITGLLVKTAWGKWIHNLTERWFLQRIPGYKTLKELFAQLKPAQERAFSKPVLISLDGNKNYFMGFITDEYGEDGYAVFIPTSPSPVNGFVVQTSSAHLKFLEMDKEALMKTVISCGVDSASMMGAIRKP